MPFRPTINSKLTIAAADYSFTEHPAAKGMPYGQTGRRATVYQVQDARGSFHALKVFTNAFRTAQTESGARRIAAFANLPGLQVCSRTVLTRQNAAALLAQYPDLEYAVLMPWVQGQTWQEILLARQPLTAEQSLNLARSFASILATMEQNGIAHCDLSGPNVLAAGAAVALVDVEDLYAPGLEQPAKLPGGSAGYGHKTAAGGLWRADADRFAGAVLLAEMLSWCDERVRRIAVGEQYFDVSELQTGCDRYQLLSQSLREKWGQDVAALLERAWYSPALSDCPTLAEWQALLLSMQQQASRAQELAAPLSSAGPVVRWRNMAEEPVSQPAPASAAVAALLKTAEMLAAQGNVEGALTVLRQARELASPAELVEINAKLVSLYDRQGFSAPPDTSQSKPFALPVSAPLPYSAPSALDDECNDAIRLFNTKNYSQAEAIFKKIYAQKPDYISKDGRSIGDWLEECRKKNGNGNSPRWRSVLWIILAWSISWAAGDLTATVIREIFVVFAITGGTGGLLTALILRREKILFSWASVFWMTIGWAVSLGIAFFAGEAIMYATSAIDRAVPYAIIGVIMGAGGLPTALALRKEKALFWVNVLWVSLSWVIGWTIAFTIVFLNQSLFVVWGQMVAFVTTGAIGGAIGGTIMIWRLRKEATAITVAPQNAQTGSASRKTTPWGWIIGIILLVILISAFVLQQKAAIEQANRAATATQQARMDAAATEQARLDVTATKRASIAATATEQANMRATATKRASIAATATEQARVAVAAVQSLRSQAKMALAPQTGELVVHDSDKDRAWVFGASLKNFIVEAEVDNPYSAGGNAWYDAINFRSSKSSAGNSVYYYLYIISDGTWYMNFYNQENLSTPANGILQNLDTSATGSNHIRLVAYNDTAYFFLNDKFIAQLDISGTQDQGSIFLLASQEAASKTTHYKNFTVWELPNEVTMQAGANVSATVESLQSKATMVSSPKTGKLVQDPNDNSTASVSSGVSLRNFIVEMEIGNPYSISENTWAHAIDFRETYADTALFLGIVSDKTWTLSLDNKGHWGTIASGTLQNLDTSPTGSNRIRLVAYNDVAYFFLNDAFIAQLDISGDPYPGGIALLASKEVAGKTTRYTNFTVWELP